MAMKVYVKLKLRALETGLLGHYRRLHGGHVWQRLCDGSVAVIGSDNRLGILEPGTFTLEHAGSSPPPSAGQKSAALGKRP